MSLLAAGLVAGGCADEPPLDPEPQPELPDPGPMRLVLTTPGSPEGAVLLSIAGPVTPVVRSSSEFHRLFSKELSPGRLRVAVVGDLNPVDVVLMLDMPDRRDADEYSVTLEQVAGKDNELREELTGYSLALQRAD